MTKHFRRELENIKKRILTLGSMVEPTLKVINDRCSICSGVRGGIQLLVWLVSKPEAKTNHGARVSTTAACQASHRPPEWVRLPE